MSQAGNTTPGDADSAAAAVLALAVGGVLPAGSAAPRLRYRRTGEGYDDDRMVIGRVVAVGDGVELCFHLPGGTVDFILVEPAAVPGSYRIPCMVYAGAVVEDLRRRVIAAGEVVVDHASPGSVRIADGRGRPAVEFDLRGLEGDGDPRLELLLQRDADGAVAAEAFVRLLDRMSADREVEQAGFARLQRDLGSASDRLRDIAEAVSGLPAMGVVQAQLIDRVDGAVAAGVARDARLDARLTALVERAVAERAASDAAAAAAVAQDAREAMARDFEGLQHVLAELQSQVVRLTNSVENVFWRRWLRRLRGGAR